MAAAQREEGSSPKWPQVASLTAQDEDDGSPRQVSFLETLPVLSGVLGSRGTMQRSVLNAATLLEGRVDPRLAALDQAIPTWVIRKAKARARRAAHAERQRDAPVRGGAAPRRARAGRLCAAAPRATRRRVRARPTARVHTLRPRARVAGGPIAPGLAVAARGVRAVCASRECAAAHRAAADSARTAASPQGIAFMWVCKVRSNESPLRAAGCNAS
jgi:hypothetical protein